MLATPSKVGLPPRPFTVPPFSPLTGVFPNTTLAVSRVNGGLGREGATGRLGTTCEGAVEVLR